jgi:hypothetical protein
MALQKSQTVNGVTGNYWQIADKSYSKDSGKTLVRLRCYVSADIRATGEGNYIGMPGFQMFKQFDGDLTTADCYTQAKASMKDSNGVETNFFADATDC